jgi:hypothetical protein
MMVVWSIPLVMITLNVMVGYVVMVFVRRPLRGMWKSRVKLALAGVLGVQIAAMSGIMLATALQIPLSFASQFVMFLVMGIGLDGVFLMVRGVGLDAPPPLPSRWAAAGRAELSQPASQPPFCCCRPSPCPCTPTPCTCRSTPSITRPPRSRWRTASATRSLTHRPRS